MLNKNTKLPELGPVPQDHIKRLDAAGVKSLPLLKATDLCEHRLQGRNGSRCLYGHVSQLPMPQQEFVWDRLTAYIRVVGYGPSVVSFNDDHGVSRPLRARIWNKVVADLGYTEGNPEA